MSGGVSPPKDRKEITMDRWVKIIEKPYCNPEDRLREFMNLLIDINAMYHNDRFYFDYRNIAHFEHAVERIENPIVGGSIVKIPEGNCAWNEKYSNSIMYDWDNRMLCFGALRYFNADLSELERACIINKWFKATKNITQNDICRKYHITKRRIPKITKDAEEILIEQWGMDFYGGVEHSRLLHFRERAEYREQRTGTWNGWLGLHPEKHLEFLPSEEEAEQILKKDPRLRKILEEDEKKQKKFTIC